MSKVTLTEVLKASFEMMISQVHTCLPGKIETYDYEYQKASVKPLIKKKYLDGKVESLPVIVNAPVLFPRTANFSFTYPLEKDDLVLILFSERSLELYLEQGGEQEPGDRRKFDLSDAIVIPGLYPFSEKSKAKNNDDVFIKYNEAELKISKDGKFRFKGDLVVEGEVTAGVTVNEEGEDEGGINLTTHIHSEVLAGGETSGPPVEE